MWVYPLLDYSMSEVGMQEVETYVSCRQNTGAQFIATRPIMDLCLEAERRPGTRVSKRWWDQHRVNVEGTWMAVREVERTDWEEETDGTETDMD